MSEVKEFASQVAEIFETFGSDQLRCVRMQSTQKDKQECRTKAEIWKDAAQCLGEYAIQFDNDKEKAMVNVNPPPTAWKEVWLQYYLIDSLWVVHALIHEGKKEAFVMYHGRDLKAFEYMGKEGHKVMPVDGACKIMEDSTRTVTGLVITLVKKETGVYEVKNKKHIFSYNE